MFGQNKMDTNAVVRRQAQILSATDYASWRATHTAHGELISITYRHPTGDIMQTTCVFDAENCLTAGPPR